MMVDGNEYNIFIEMQAKSPVKPVYAAEGTPFVTSPTAVFEQAREELEVGVERAAGEDFVPDRKDFRGHAADPTPRACPAILL